MGWTQDSITSLFMHMALSVCGSLCGCQALQVKSTVNAHLSLLLRWGNMTSYFTFTRWMSLLVSDWVNFKWRHRQSRHFNQPRAVTAESQPCTEIFSIYHSTGGATVCAGQEIPAAAEKDARYLLCFHSPDCTKSDERNTWKLLLKASQSEGYPGV